MPDSNDRESRSRLSGTTLDGRAETYDVGAQIRMKPAVRRIGWAYVCYHLAVFLVALYDAAAKYWSIGDFLGEVAMGFVLYPALVPALTLCGGVHQGCESAVGRTMQLFVLGLVVSWAIVGWHVALSTGWRWARCHQALGE